MISTHVFWALVLLIPAGLEELEQEPKQEGRLGTVVAPFRLADTHNQPVSLHGRDHGARGTVLAFLAPSDPGGAADAAVLAKLELACRAHGLRFLAVVVDRSRSADSVRSWAADAGLVFPILLDPMQGLADRLGVRRLGYCVLLDAGDRIVYRGAIQGEGVGLPDALSALMGVGGQEVFGEELFRRSGSASALPLLPLAQLGSEVAVEFRRDVAPIFERHCVVCHRPGQIGPMVLADFDEARGWAPMIAEVVSHGRMPPWNANPRHGEFANERVLTETEKATLVHWARIGAPEGEGSAAAGSPPVVEWASPDWRIGVPDVIYELPEDQVIPATGVVPYQYAMVDPKIGRERWVKTIEVRHTAPEVAHHVFVYLIPPGMDRHQFLSLDRNFSNSVLVGIASGNLPAVFADGVARRIPAGFRFLFQLHYTPNGAPAVDRPQMGIVWADPDEVQYELVTRGVTNGRIDIKPGLDDQAFFARMKVKEDVALLGMSPHMHTRGKSFKFERFGVDGQREVLLDVSSFDFNWQHNYILREPRWLRAGDNLLLTAVYDNSSANPSNPDPTARVRWGEQTWDEMFLGALFLRVPIDRE